MLEEIRECVKCGLCRNQRPLLDTPKACQVFWVGLSAKKAVSDNDIPLSPDTVTGKVIREIEEKCPGISAYRTNLVKCLPLDGRGKLRYPTSTEIDSCFENLEAEIDVLKPSLVFLLGEKVSKAAEKHLGIRFPSRNGYDYTYSVYNGICYVPVHHPSYVYVYRRGKANLYTDSVKKMIERLL